MKKCLFFIIFICMAYMDDHYINHVSNAVDRTLKLSLSNKKNETGHWVTRLFVDSKSNKLPNVWNMDVEYRIIEKEESNSFNLLGVVTTQPYPPADYELYHGIGYYKFHTDLAKDFDEALASCSKEGGHLAIINSEAESNVMMSIFKRYANLKIQWAYIGLHDRQNEGNFVTIFNQPLNSTGYNRWYSPHEPNGGRKENCGTMNRNGGINDEYCNSTLPFFCEFDLSWSEN